MTANVYATLVPDQTIDKMRDLKKLATEFKNVCDVSFLVPQSAYYDGRCGIVMQVNYNDFGQSDKQLLFNQLSAMGAVQKVDTSRPDHVSGRNVEVLTYDSKSAPGNDYTLSK